MAYVKNGSFFSSNETKWKVSGYTDDLVQDNTLITLDDGYAMAFFKLYDSDLKVYKYEFKAFKIPNSEYNFSGKSTLTRTTIVKGGEPRTEIIDGAIGSLYDGTSQHSDYDSIYFFDTSTNIPIFDNNKDFENYVTTGEIKNELNTKKINTDWILAIDGTKSPLYKLKWSCASISENDIARIRIGYGGYDDISGKISIHKWQLVDYSPSHFNTNYAQINNAVWGEIAEIVSPLATLAAVYIAVQLEYYSTPTVLPSQYSSIMYCELFKNKNLIFDFYRTNASSSAASASSSDC